MGVIPTVVIQPRHLRTQIERRSIAVLLDQVDASRVTTLCAPAGYGKTIAMLQLAEALAVRGRAVLWLAARAGITTAEEFTEALKVAASVAQVALPALAHGASLAELLTVLASQQRERPVLVIDDAQLLPGAVLAEISQVVASARDALTTIIASRSRATIPLARLRSLGCLLEIGASDLRFTLQETVEFIAKNGRAPIDSALVQALVEETGGWAAGIVMAATVLRPEWSNGTPLRPSGLRLEFESYFDEEVMSLQPREVRDFLASTAVLDDLTPPACAAVTGLEDGRRMLERVDQMGLFVDRVDIEDARYRYHPLFREMILRRMRDRDPARAAELHRRASRYFAAAGDLPLAIGHAELSKDDVFLADQLDTLAEQLVYGGYLYRIDALASGMPGEILATRPALLLALAWRRIRSLSFTSAEALITAAEAYLRKAEGADDLSAWRMQHLARAIRHRRIMLDAARDDMPKVERAAEALVAELGDEQPYLSCTLLAQLMSARRELYHFRDILKLEAETRRALSRPGSSFASIALKASVAPTLLVQGKVEPAEEMLDEALALARSLQGDGSGLAALPALPLAELYYDRGETDRARTLIDAHLPLARQWGFVDQLASGHVVHARLLAGSGDMSAALKALDEAHLLAIECGLDRLRAYVVGEQVRMLMRAGEQQSAEAAFQAGGLVPETEPYPTLSPTRQHESIAIAWIRIEMQNHRLVRARKVAKRWSEFVRRAGAIRSAIAFELLLAEIAVLEGDRAEARRAMREAVAFAAPRGWSQIFLDEGQAVGSLLIEAYGEGPALDGTTDRFAVQLLALFTGSPVVDAEDEQGLGCRLVNRELEILRMVGGGLRNREIGNRLGLTEGTVKWYMQQIYDKLGVRRRPQAVMRARQLGILA